MAFTQDQLDALERSVNEIDALEMIYGDLDGEDDGESSFSIVSLSEMELARSILSGDLDGKLEIPSLELQIKSSIELNDIGKSVIFTLRVSLPVGYPDVPAFVTAYAEGLRRSIREDLSSHLREVSKSMVGSESIMGLMETLKEVGPIYVATELDVDTNSKQLSSSDETNNTAGNSRRWIWVHHITNPDRRKAIINEARDHSLGGYLKFGYPGIIVIEGKKNSCDEFVTWVKGNKSRPGGFGRNWGHHVRGEINLERSSPRSLPIDFLELEDMAMLGSLCKEHGIETEFREFCLQHKG